ncbi:accessory gene regulator ArgB-like protein [Desulfitobacterium hafniense]|uniref:accessory gene regulator ArgB-like protein n=1 Tax=Desulfitobacterium hafniense TaxID=49338 RepID=UPI0003648E95|nr:accessory gene regulator B family protein [Desulfitobacterium hafniense]
MGIPDLSCSIANYFGRELELDEDKTDILRYGFEVIIGEGIKVISIFVMASLLGLTPYVLVAFLTVGTYRLFSGGYHSETYSRCFMFSMFLFLGMGKITQLLLPYFKLSVVQIITLIFIVFVWSLWIAIKWAPAETPNKPLAEGEKTRQKKLSVIWVLLWFLVTSFLVLAFPVERTGIIALGTLLAHIFQSFSVTPLGFKVMCSFDTLRIK